MVGSQRRWGLKRALDITLATCGLIALTPFMAAAAVAIRITIGEPVLFRQERPGLKGRPFTILKFRSMSSATGPDGELLPEAERLTWLGYWMRKTSFDELPELWNVLRGEMSVVGPRPLLMRYLPLYSAEQMRRHDAKPGITGLAQVRGRHTLDWAERFRLDTWYVDNWSLRLDAWVIRETLSVLLKGQAGFESGPGRVTFSWHGNDDRSNPTMLASPEDQTQGFGRCPRRARQCSAVSTRGSGREIALGWPRRCQLAEVSRLLLRTCTCQMTAPPTVGPRPRSFPAALTAYPRGCNDARLWVVPLDEVAGLFTDVYTMMMVVVTIGSTA